MNVGASILFILSAIHANSGLSNPLTDFHSTRKILHRNRPWSISQNFGNKIFLSNDGFGFSFILWGDPLI